MAYVTLCSEFIMTCVLCTWGSVGCYCALAPSTGQNLSLLCLLPDEERRVVGGGGVFHST